MKCKLTHMLTLWGMCQRPFMFLSQFLQSPNLSNGQSVLVPPTSTRSAVHPPQPPLGTHEKSLNIYTPVNSLPAQSADPE